MEKFCALQLEKTLSKCRRIRVSVGDCDEFFNYEENIEGIFTCRAHLLSHKHR